MDNVSSLLFAAVVVAWVVYLVPKALAHSDDSGRSKTVERFSERMRVLARREPAAEREARLVREPTPGRKAPSAAAESPGTSPAETPRPVASRPAVPTTAARRAAARKATRRRQVVLAVLLTSLLTIVATAAFSLHSWWYVAIPATLIAAWLVMCRVMVKTERRSGSARPSARAAAPVAEVAPEAPETARAEEAKEAEPAGDVEQSDDDTNHQGIPVVRDPNLWDPVPVTLPTYVDKEPAARRTVRTIDLDATGVWTSGRTAEDSALAREAEEAERAAKAAVEADQQRRAAGS
ncbi:MAG: hypothetical protein LCH60_15350 [Actinobacteria bacterium]|nr:hypothetical protein [Actinomycetota bacterium]